jgi:hypothetical protein
MISNKNYHKINFHSHTFCIWKEVAATEIQELKLNFKSKHDSHYYFTTDGVYRFSDHWGRVANCHWRLVPISKYKNQKATVAFARWDDFYTNDASSKLFFIKVDIDTQEVNFYHKLVSDYDGKLGLRNANETAKTIKNIKQVLTENDWAKYLNYTDLELLRKEVIEDLVASTQSFLEIKRKYQ